MRKVKCDQAKCQNCDQCVFDNFKSVHGGILLVNSKNSDYLDRSIIIAEAIKTCPGHAISIHIVD